MSPREDKSEPEEKPDVTVDIPHEPEAETPPPPSAPPLPILEPPAPTPPPEIPKAPTPPSPPPPPPAPAMQPAIEEFHERHESRRWPAVLLYGGLALLVAVGVVFGGRWIYRQTNKKPAAPQPTPAGTGQQPPQVPGEPAQPSQPSGPSTAASGGQSTQTVATNGQLPNNGPGDVAAIFVGTAVIFGGAHFLYNLRRNNS